VRADITAMVIFYMNQRQPLPRSNECKTFASILQLLLTLSATSSQYRSTGRAC